LLKVLCNPNHSTRYLADFTDSKDWLVYCSLYMQDYDYDYKHRKN